MCKHIEDIRFRLAESGRSTQWLAHKSGIHPHQVYYLLNHAKDIKLEVYNKMMLALDHNGEELPEANTVSEASIRLSAVVNQEMADLQRKVLEYLADGRIDNTERQNLVARIDHLKKTTQSSCNELLTILKRG